MNGSITDVAGITVGHWTNGDARTGCSVVLCPAGTTASGEVRGGAPGTRETDLLRPGMTVEEAHAVVLAGGSAYGLAAADGVMRWLEEHGVGLDTGAGIVPIVPSAVLFDLAVGDGSVRPNADSGYAACEAASVEVAEGRVGAGAGATVAKHLGLGRAVDGGIGTASAREGDLIVGALVAVNAVGEILGEDGSVVAGALPEHEAAAGVVLDMDPRGNTTIGVVATNAKLGRQRLHLLANSAHDGMDEAISPSHTKWDGDTLFTLATNEVDAPTQAILERMARNVVAGAIRSAIHATNASL